VTVPFAVKWAIESSNPAEPRHPPSTRELLERIRERNAAAAAAAAAAGGDAKQ
jgi:hypothetical protein